MDIHFYLVTGLITEPHQRQLTITKEAAPKCVNTFRHSIMFLTIRGSIMPMAPPLLRLSSPWHEGDYQCHHRCQIKTSDSLFIHNQAHQVDNMNQRPIKFMVGRETGFHVFQFHRLTA